MIHAYNKWVQEFGPDDYFSLKKFIEKHSDTLTFRDILTVIRLSAYDARIFKQMLPHMLQLVTHMIDNQRWDFLRVIPRIRDTYYPIGESDDLGLSLRDLLSAMGFLDEAISFYEKSLEMNGKQLDVLFKLALIY